MLNQSHKMLEIIVIDDGSPDKLFEIVEAFTEIDNRVKFIRQDNSGASGARNSGLEKASGDYIFFLDSDDWIEPYTIELLLKKAITEDADVVMPDRYTKISLEGKITEEALFIDYDKYKTVSDFVVNIIIGRGRAWRVSSVLYKSHFIKEYTIRFPEGHTAEDVIFNLEVLSKVDRLAFVSKPTLNVNKRKDSVTATYHSNLFETYLLIDKKAQEYIKEVEYNEISGNIAVDSLLCRNIVFLIRNEMSSCNKKTFTEKVKRINHILNTNRVKNAFNQNKFIYPYWNSKIKVYYVVLMRNLIKYNLKFLAILLAMI